MPVIAEWARGRLGDRDTTEDSERSADWSGSHPDADRARALLLRSAGSAPDIVRDYLANISDKALKRVRKDIIESSAPIVEALPFELSVFVKRAFLLDHDSERRSRHAMMREMAETLGFDDDRAFYPAPRPGYPSSSCSARILTRGSRWYETSAATRWLAGEGPAPVLAHSASDHA